MIFVQTDNHEQAFSELLDTMSNTKLSTIDPELIIEDRLVINITNKLQNINAALFTGKDFILPNFIKRHTKTNILADVIRHYLDLLDDGIEIQWIIDYLKTNPFSKRAVINFWKKEDSNITKKCPCVIYFMFRITIKGLEMSTHMRSNDVNRKMLLNLYLFDSIHTYMAKSLKLPKAPYLHVVDTLIVHRADKAMFGKMCKQIVNDEEYFYNRH